MIDLRKAIAALARVTQAADRPNPQAIAAALGLDLTYATATIMRGGDLALRDAMVEDGSPVDIVAGVSPRRRLHLFLAGAGPAYRDIAKEIFGADQHIQPSKASEGFAIVFYVDGLEFAMTADSPNHRIGGIFCMTRRMRVDGS